jgi:NAD(P)-dependent dehydrogenase (short-subunit alcohol dehydrogenase family)
MKILITGVTRGLGRALAEFYIKAGHTVLGCGRSGEAIFDLRMTHGAPHDFAVWTSRSTTRSRSGRPRC